MYIDLGTPQGANAEGRLGGVFLKTSGGQIDVSILKGNVTKLYNANPDVVIKKRDSLLTSFVKWKVHPLYKVTLLHLDTHSKRE